MPNHINRIVFTGDALRSESGEPNQLQNVIWLKEKIGCALQVLCQLPLEISFPRTKDEVREFCGLQGFRTTSFEEWAFNYHRPASDRLAEKIAKAFENALVIAIEMPPAIEDALDRAKIPWIDIGISPLRFMPDWAIHIKHSNHFESPALAAFQLQNNEINQYVCRVKKYYSPQAPQKRNLVFFCQTIKDRTLIHNQTFAGTKEVQQWYEAIDKDFNLLVKPHPGQPQNPVIDFLEKAGGKITTENTYAILSAENTDIATLSSSVGLEAKYFGRTTTTLCPKTQSRAFSGINILRHARSPLLWGMILNRLGIETHNPNEGNWPTFPPLRADAAAQGLDVNIWTQK